jgi:hypothetical protein
VYFDPEPLGAPIFFGAITGSMGASYTAGRTIFSARVVLRVVARFDGFAAVSGITLFLVRLDAPYGNRID